MEYLKKHSLKMLFAIFPAFGAFFLLFIILQDASGLEFILLQAIAYVISVVVIEGIYAYVLNNISQKYWVTWITIVLIVFLTVLMLLFRRL